MKSTAKYLVCRGNRSGCPRRHTSADRCGRENTRLGHPRSLEAAATGRRQHGCHGAAATRREPIVTTPTLDSRGLGRVGAPSRCLLWNPQSNQGVGYGRTTGGRCADTSTAHRDCSAHTTTFPHTTLSARGCAHTRTAPDCGHRPDAERATEGGGVTAPPAPVPERVAAAIAAQYHDGMDPFHQPT